MHDMWMHMHPTALVKAVTYEPPWNSSELILVVLIYLMPGRLAPYKYEIVITTITNGNIITWPDVDT